MLLKRWKLFKDGLSDKNLNNASVRCLFFLLERENSKTGALFPSHDRLSKDTGLSARSVRRGIDRLIKYNYVIKLKKGGPGRATSYQINYEQRTILSQTEDKIVKNIRTKMTDQSTYNLLNKSKLNNIIKRATKNTHSGYKAVVENKKKSFKSVEMIAQRILRKTNNPVIQEAYLKLANSPNFDDKARAEYYAKSLGCLSD